MFHVRALKNAVYLCAQPTDAHLKICSLTYYLLLVKNNNMWLDIFINVHFLVDHKSKHVRGYSGTSISVTRKYGVVQCITVRVYQDVKLILVFCCQVCNYGNNLLLSLSSSSSSSPLCRVFILIFLRQTTSLENTVLQLFCCYYSRCLYS